MPQTDGKDTINRGSDRVHVPHVIKSDSQGKRIDRYVMTDSEHEDLCFDCGITGELLECDECPRVYHYDCGNIPADEVPGPNDM